MIHLTNLKKNLNLRDLNKISISELSTGDRRFLNPISYGGGGLVSIISRDSRGTRADPNKVHDQPWSFIGPLQGPLKGPCDLRDSARLFSLFLKNTFSKPSEHHGIRLWSVLHFTKAQGTLMDLHGPPNGPSNWPCELILGDPCRWKALQGPNWSIFMIDLKTTDKLKNTAWFEVNWTFGCREIIF